MTTQQMNLLAMIGLAVCWAALALTWLLAAILYEPQAPPERIRARSWLGASIGLATVLAVSFAVPRADWRSLTFYAPPVRILGLAILLAEFPGGYPYYRQQVPQLLPGLHLISARGAQ